MRVCLDIQAALGQRAGVGRYARELARHLPAAAGEGDEVRGFCFDFSRKGTAEAAPGLVVKACRWCPGRVAQQLWKRAGWPPYPAFAGEADVYHFPNFIRPPMGRSRAKTVVTIHDVSFLRMPETTEEKNLAWLRAGIFKTAREADAILTDSEFSAREICETLDVPPEKVSATWLGLPPLAEAEDGAEAARLRAEMGLTRPYLLMVGTLEPRKNIPFLVKVFEEMRGFDGDLALVGGLGWKTEPILEAIAGSKRTDRIKRLSHIPDAALAAAYAGASAFVFPSRYEGFGLPPLEAMARGTPVVCARNSSLPEVLGDAAEWVDGWDAREWAARVEAVVASDSRRAELRAAGLARAKLFRWEDTARKTWNVYRLVANAR